MPSAALLVVISCRHGARRVGATLESVGRQTSRPHRIAVVAEPSIDERGAAVLRRVSAEAGIEVLWSAAETPGAMWNLAIGRGGVEWVACLDEGDTLGERYFERAEERLRAEPSIGFVAGWVRRQVDGGRSLPAGLPACDLAALLVDPWAVPTSAVFRRRLWEDTGGFDERLPILEDYEFWLRALARGWRGELLEEALIFQQARGDSRYRRGLETETHMTSMRAVLGAHLRTFETHLEHVLVEKERQLCHLLDRHKLLVDRRDRLVAELRAIERERASLGTWLRDHGRDALDWGDLRRISPLSRNWGYERGKPIDRYYIEQFVETCAADVRGVVLEVQESDLTRQVGGARIERVDVLDINADNPNATVVDDLRTAATIASETYDCLIVTQTIHVIDDMRAVLAQCLRILKPGGVLLVTLPSASRVCLEYGPRGDFWRVTEAGARALFEEFFPPDRLRIRSYGNVLVNAAFLYGMGCHELTEEEFEAPDPFFPLLIGIRAVKPGLSLAVPLVTRRDDSDGRGAAVLLYHRVADVVHDVHGLCVGVNDFMDHIEHLSRGYHVMALPELLEAARSRTIPPRAVAVTFDDGYVDNLAVASPILETFDVPATFFVTTAWLGGHGEFWWDTLERLFLSDAQLPAMLDIDWEDGRVRHATQTHDERVAAHWSLYGMLYRSARTSRDELLRRLVAWSGVRLPVRDKDRPLTRAELVRLARRPLHTIGAHGRDHLALPTQGAEGQREDVRASRAELEEILGVPVQMFAYPFGHHDDVTRAIVGEIFDVAVTCEARLFVARDDLLRLPRCEVRAGGIEQFRHFLATLFRTPTARPA